MKRLLAALTCATALAVTGAGCGSSSPHKGAAGATPTSSATTTSAPEIPVGVIGSFSGPEASSVGVGKATIQAWASYVNDNGGINGHRVHLYVFDDQGNAQTSVTDVKTLVQQDHVVAIVGQAAAPGDATWASYIESSGVPVIGGTSNDGIYMSNPDYFAAAGNSLSDFYGIAQVAAKDGPKTGVLYCAELPDCAQVVPLVKGFAQSLGLSVPVSLAVSGSAPDYTSVCQGLKSAGVSSYILGLGAATLKRVAAQCAQQGLRAIPIIPNVADESFASDSSLSGLQVIDNTFPFFANSTPATQAFRAALQRYAPSVGGSSEPLNSFAAVTWASGQLFADAVKAAPPGPITAATVKQGLYSLRGDTLGGLAPPITFNQGKASLINCYFSYSIQNGAYTLPNGLTPTCAPEAAIAAIASKL